MIAHVILFQPRPDLTRAQRSAVLAALESAAREAPTVRACRVGRRVMHGVPGYEQSMSQHFEFAAIIEFDDLEGLRAYLHHPAHQTIGQQFSTAAAGALAYDYDMRGLEDAHRLME